MIMRNALKCSLHTHMQGIKELNPVQLLQIDNTSSAEREKGNKSIRNDNASLHLHPCCATGRRASNATTCPQEAG